MRARALLAIDDNPQKSIQRFTAESEGYTQSATAARYGLALALSRGNQHERAQETLAELLTDEPHNLHYRLAGVELAFNRGDYEASLARIAELESLHGGNYALQRYKADALLKLASERVLEALSRQRPNDPEVWFELAETSGLAGDIVGVHKARAEYFILIGVYDKAREQLNYAKRLVGDNYRENAVLNARLEEVEKRMEKAKQL